MSPVEHAALTVNIALRREAATLDYYRTGSSPDAFATLPKEWTIDHGGISGIRNALAFFRNKERTFS